MPCYMTGTAEGDASLAASEAIQRTTELTRLLCMQLEALENTNNEHLIHRAVLPWWNHHKEIDQQRKNNVKKARENAKVAARAKKKLTREERAALGLKD